MNSFEFYSKLQQYKDTLSHASIPASYKKLATGLNNMKNYGYYNKIDNFYGPGKSRYFYSKDEWDAYQREKNRIYDKAKANQEKAEEERIKKYGSNAEKAQLARRNEEQKATLKEIERQTQNLKEKSSRNAKVVDDLIKFIQKSGGNTNDAIRSMLKESLGDNYDVTKDLKIGFKGVSSIAPDLYKQIKEIEDKEDEIEKSRAFSYDDYNKKSKPGWEAYEEKIEKEKANLEYKKQKIYEEFNNIMYKNIMDAIDNLIENNDPRKTAAIKKALWELTNTDEFEKYRKTIDDDLFRRIKSYALIMPNDSNTETWDNSKNIETWDKGETLKENVIKENILKENVLKEATIKPIEVKEIEVKPIKVKKIK